MAPSTSTRWSPRGGKDHQRAPINLRISNPRRSRTSLRSSGTSHRSSGIRTSLGNSDSPRTNSGEARPSIPPATATTPRGSAATPGTRAGSAATTDAETPGGHPTGRDPTTRATPRLTVRVLSTSGHGIQENPVHRRIPPPPSAVGGGGGAKPPHPCGKGGRYGAIMLIKTEGPAEILVESELLRQQHDVSHVRALARDDLNNLNIHP